ncbi:MAG TPA: NAD(P)/FAD-dependent oxidoreductase [Vicinamibacteria bacterium]|nr:NAD(P)/FAD-dependent oxidoreductase [Vicinamibacteria bacterium]
MTSAVRDVVVVGGGPAGAAISVFLRRRGHDVVLLDEARFPRDKVCGEGISPEAWRLLADLGVDGDVRALRPHPLRGMALVSPDGTPFRGLYRRRDDDLGFAVRRERFDHVLLEHARRTGVEVREGTRAGAVLWSAAGEGHAVTVANGASPERIRARLVVGADGRRSVVARSLGLLREHRRLRKFAVRGHWRGMQELDECGEMHVAAGGYCGIAPLGEGLANVAFVLDQRDMAAAGGDLEGFYRSSIAARWPRLAERLAGAELTAPPRAIGPLALQASALSAPGALLVGDAAGFYDPFTGEGVTLALRSAELAAGVADAALRSGHLGDLRAYDRARHAATRDKFRLNRLLQRVVAWPALADAVARRLSRRPDLADQLVGIAGDFVPARTALGPRFVWDLLRS